MPNYGKYKKRSYRKTKRVTNASFVKRVKRVVLNNIAEKKRVLHTVRSGEVDWSGRRVDLTLIAQGTGEDQRIGRMVTPHSIVCKATLRNTDATSIDRYGYQILLVQDLQTVGDDPADVSEIISDVNTSYAHIGLLNVNNKGRFKILKRWSGNLMPLSSSSTSPTFKTFDFYYKFPSKAIKNLRYNGPSSTDIEANHLSLIWITNADPASDAVLLDANIRLWYSDV